MRTLAFVVALAGYTAGCNANAPGAMIDAGACAKVVYDPCATEHDCANGDCRTLTPPGGSAAEVCTQPCGSGMPCPADATGQPGTCDATALLCVPAKPNACTITLD